MRLVGPGYSLNVLCALGVWPRCVETAVCDLALGVNKGEFRAPFLEDPVLWEATQARGGVKEDEGTGSALSLWVENEESLAALAQERAVMTGHFMVPDPGALAN